MNKILVPIDFSDTSLNALLYAIKLFEGLDIEITVLHTFELSSSAFHMKSMDDILERDAQQEIDAFIKKVKDKEPAANLIPKIMKGEAISIITSLGNGGDYDFIVMGTKGASGLKEVFVGSVAGGVISKTLAPVIVVPKDYLYHPLKEIVFAISGIALSDVSVVEPLRKLAKLHSSKIKVLHAAEGKRIDLEEIMGTIKDLDPSVTYAFSEGNVNQRLNDYLKDDEDAGLLCLIRGKKDFFSRIFTESVTLKQTFNSPIPLLILHN